MTKERAKQLIPVLNAWVSGKAIQVGVVGKWGWETYTGDCAEFDHDGWRWRVRPEPGEYWIVHPVGNRFAMFTLDKKPNPSNSPTGMYDIIHVKEVVE